jgi:hypothetical protein
MQLVSLFLASVSFAAVANDACKVVAQDCSFYERCAEPHFQCGPKGYALGYGGKYCQAFKDNVDKFSPQGQKWIYSVMTCLQEKIVPLVEANTKMTCDKFRSFAYGTHPGCYTLPENSICRLPQDWAKLLVIIRQELFDPATFKQAIAVARACGSQFFQAIFDAVDDDTKVLLR